MQHLKKGKVGGRWAKSCEEKMRQMRWWEGGGILPSATAQDCNFRANLPAEGHIDDDRPTLLANIALPPIRPLYKAAICSAKGPASQLLLKFFMQMGDQKSRGNRIHSAQFEDFFIIIIWESGWMNWPQQFLVTKFGGLPSQKTNIKLRDSRLKLHGDLHGWMDE